MDEIYIVQAIREAVKEEVQTIRKEVKEEVQAIRKEVKEEVQTIRKEVKEEVQTIRRELTPLFKTIFDKFDDMDDRFDDMDERMDRMEKFSKDEKAYTTLLHEDIKRNLYIMGKDTHDIKQDVSMLKKDVCSIQITIENEIRPDIKDIRGNLMEYVNEVREMREDMQWVKDSVEENSALIGAVAKEAGIELAEKITE